MVSVHLPSLPLFLFPYFSLAPLIFSLSTLCALNTETRTLNSSARKMCKKSHPTTNAEEEEIETEERREGKRKKGRNAFSLEKKIMARGRCKARNNEMAHRHETSLPFPPKLTISIFPLPCPTTPRTGQYISLPSSGRTIPPNRISSLSLSSSLSSSLSFSMSLPLCFLIF